MDMDKMIERINFLYKKSKEEGLNEEEKLEQQQIRRQYIDIVKGNFKQQLSRYKYEPKN